MNRTIILGIVLLLTVRVSGALEPIATSHASFSADVASMGDAPGGGSMTMTGRIFAANGLIRRESVDEGHLMVVINDPAKKSSLHLVPDQGFYEDVSELSGTPGGFYTDDLIPGAPADLFVHNTKNPCAGSGELHCSLIRHFSVNQRPCAEWRFKPAAHPAWTECIDERLGIIIKLDKDGRSFTLSNIREGKLDPSLFRVPGDLKLVALAKDSYGADYESAPPAQ